jgi:hypothetical protein
MAAAGSAYPGDALADRPVAQWLLRRWSDHWVRHDVGYWAVSWRDDPEVLGFCGVKVMTLRARCPISSTAWTRVRGARVSAARRRPSSNGPCGTIPAVRSSPGCDRLIYTSVRVALKAWLVRAAELDSLGEDGPDWIFASPGWTTT